MRIVSLLPSATEILCELGLEDQLVGVTHSCDYPASVLRLPKVTSTVIPKDAPGGEIDRLVRERHLAGSPLYQLDEGLLARLKPDLLVTQGLCDVCAVADSTVADVASRLPGRPELVSLAPTRLIDVLGDILALGRRTRTDSRAQAVVTGLRARVAAVQGRAEMLPHPRVTLLEWTDPLYAAGHWTPELVTLAGGIDGHAKPGDRSRRMEWEEVRAWQPEVLVLACCGLDAERSQTELRLLAKRPGFTGLPCVVEGRVFVMDGQAYLSRPGPRLVESLEMLAGFLHPARFPPRAGRVSAGTLASFSA
jgi:iron complex transport system substrate-binding protein